MNINKIIFPVITAAALISIYVVYGSKIETLPRNAPIQKEVVQEIPENWQPFTHEISGLKLYAPNTYVIEKSGNLSFQLLDKSVQEPVGNVSFFYFSYIPDFENANATEIYNSDKLAIDKLLRLNVDEETTLSETPDLAGWFTYKRESDEVLGGKTFMKFVNIKPWEFPAGTTEIRYINKESNKVYLLGVYSNQDKITAETATSVFESITFTTAKGTDLVTEELDYTAGTGWLTFEDNTYGFIIKYPSEWSVTPAPSEGLGGLVRLTGKNAEEDVYIEIGKLFDLKRNADQKLRDIELARSPQTRIVEERMLLLNGRETYQQKVEMVAGGTDSKLYGVYNIFEIDGEFYFAELYTNKPYEQEEIVENVVALIKKTNKTL